MTYDLCPSMCINAIIKKEHLILLTPGFLYNGEIFRVQEAIFVSHTGLPFSGVPNWFCQLYKAGWSNFCYWFHCRLRRFNWHCSLYNWSLIICCSCYWYLPVAGSHAIWYQIEGNTLRYAMIKLLHSEKQIIVWPYLKLICSRDYQHTKLHNCSYITLLNLQHILWSYLREAEEKMEDLQLIMRR